MKFRLLNAALALVLASLACNLPGGQSAQPTETATAENQPAPALVFNTEAPSETPPPPTETPPQH